MFRTCMRTKLKFPFDEIFLFKSTTVVIILVSITFFSVPDCMIWPSFVDNRNKCSLIAPSNCKPLNSHSSLASVSIRFLARVVRSTFCPSTQDYNTIRNNLQPPSFIFSVASACIIQSFKLNVPFGTYRRTE